MLKHNTSNLWRAVEMASKAGHEINQMMEQLSSLLIEQLAYIGGVQKVRESEADELFDRSEWVNVSYLQNFHIYKDWAREHHKAVLGIETIIGEGTRGEPITGATPCVNILFSTDVSADWVYSDKQGVQLYKGAEFWTEYQYDLVGDGGLILQDVPNGWYDIEECFFSVPLLSLNSSADLERLIIGPVKALLTQHDDYLSHLSSTFAGVQGILRFEPCEYDGFRLRQEWV